MKNVLFQTPVNASYSGENDSGLFFGGGVGLDFFPLEILSSPLQSLHPNAIFFF